MRHPARPAALPSCRLAVLIRGACLGPVAVALASALPASLPAQRGASAPTNVTVVGAGSSVTVAWSPVRGMGVTYRILRALKAQASGVEITKTADVYSIVDPNVVPGTTYYYQVEAVYGDGTTGAAAPVGFTVPAPVALPAFHAPAKSLGLSGQVLPLAPASAGLVRPGFLKEIYSNAKCNAAQPPVGGPSPSSFFLSQDLPGGPIIGWPGVPGAVAYVVERAVDGTNNWTMAATTCGSPNAIRQNTSGTSATVYFRDISGGIAPNGFYVYRVTAFGGSGETGWNSTRWATRAAPAPLWSSPPVITGSTAKLTFVFGHTNIHMADEWVLTAPDGRKWTGSFVGPLLPISVTVLGLPVGTHTFTLTAQWVQDLDPKLPRVMATSSAQTTVTIKI